MMSTKMPPVPDTRAAGPEPLALRWGRRIRALLLSQRVRPVWLLAVTLWVIFTGFRTGLLIANRDSLGDVGASQIVRCLLIGLRYDAMPIGYTLAPMATALALAPNLAFPRRWFRRLITAYGALLLTLAGTIEVIGAAFFMQFGARLNWLALDYLGSFTEVAAYVWENYPAWLLPVGIVAGFVGSFLALDRLFWRGTAPTGPIWRRPILAIVYGGLCFLGCRGSAGLFPLTESKAYFTRNEVVNQLSMNNVFTLTRAVVSLAQDTLNEEEDFLLPPFAAACEESVRMIHLPGDSPLNQAGNPLARRTATSRPLEDYNVVVILMEGMAGLPVGVLGNDPSFTPNLDRLCGQGLYLERMYASGGRTCQGMVSVLCGYPDLCLRSVMKRSRSQGRFLMLPRIFQQRGYRTLFIYGGDPTFDNMKGFLMSGGVETVIGEDQMEGRSNIWGVPDEFIFRKAHETFLNLGDRRFFAVILTISNHEPFTVPTQKVPLLPPENQRSKLVNGYLYADWALAEFLHQAEQADYFRRTLFVLVSDHGREMKKGRIVDVPGHHIPCLFYAPGLIPPRRVGTVCGQADIAPTLLALLGGSYDHCFFGRNLLAVDEKDGFAFLHETERMAFVHGERVVLRAPDCKPLFYRTGRTASDALTPIDRPGPEDEAVDMQMRCYYSLARHLYLKGLYRLAE
jgi:phosphoglycerol transferase MdoB-like AlkP superfamily enzyme